MRRDLEIVPLDSAERSDYAESDASLECIKKMKPNKLHRAGNTAFGCLVEELAGSPRK